VFNCGQSHHSLQVRLTTWWMSADNLHAVSQWSEQTVSGGCRWSRWRRKVVCCSLRNGKPQVLTAGTIYPARCFASSLNTRRRNVHRREGPIERGTATDEESGVHGFRLFWTSCLGRWTRTQK